MAFCATQATNSRVGGSFSGSGYIRPCPAWVNDQRTISGSQIRSEDVEAKPRPVFTMSRSPERISSYRRHFEDTTTSSYQVRVSSPSPVRRDAGRCRSASYSRTAAASSSSMAVGRRTLSSTRGRPLMTGVGVGTVCVSAGGAAIDLEAVAAENQEFLSTRTGERKEMVALNDRLAAYIEKVRSLEQQNKLLETEIEALQNRFLKPTGLRMLYEEQLRELRRVADQMRMQRDVAIGAKDAMAGQLEMIKVKYEEAVELRKKAEMDIEAFRPDVDAATSARIALEKQLEHLEIEIEFLQRVHKEEIEELLKQMYSAYASVQDAYSLPDLAGAIQQVQLQYEDISAKNLQDMDSWYRNKFDDLNNKSTRHVDTVRGVREEIAGAKKDIQGKERNLDGMKSKNEGLEAQLRETQERHKKELEALQARIEALQLELKTIKEKIALHLREYQDLLNVKMGLELEITTYRKLIEGEDSRITSMVQGMSTMSLMASSSFGAISGGMGAIGGGLGAVNGLGRIGGGLGVVGGGLGGMDASTAGGIGAMGARGGIAGGVGAMGAMGADVAGGVGGQAARGGVAGGVGTLGAMGADVVGGVGGQAARGGVAGGVGILGAMGADVVGGQAARDDIAGGIGTLGAMGADAAAGVGAPGAKGGIAGGVGAPGAIGIDAAGGIGAPGAKGGIAGGVGAPGAIGADAAGGYGAPGAKGGTAGGVGAPGAIGIDAAGGVGAPGAKGGIAGGVGAPGAIGIDAAGGVGAPGVKGGVVAGVGALGGMGADAAGGLGALGVKGGIAGGVGAGITGLGGGFGAGFGEGTIIDYSKEQAVEVTERKTVLIRTVKADDETVQRDMQERIYSISGAAQEEEE
ncbi:keratin, type II cytoskeletal isoform X2 [Astyanax mexicanus]|uniref:keratin, type II cytoskeletal isoform X2 n=1 Tax=Astyanax mexicanus TaxID=7994 RepID=UPI0020CB3E59|nr:keratin, type II cytoskeletal isoform X2 [Astyanax mexicanus]